MVPIAPAITNGIFDAVGARIKQIPATPERVFWAIRKRRENNQTPVWVDKFEVCYKMLVLEGLSDLMSLQCPS